MQMDANVLFAVDYLPTFLYPCFTFGQDEMSPTTLLVLIIRNSVHFQAIKCLDIRIWALFTSMKEKLKY